ncbi:tim21p [Saccharomyces arboricola H-6]|uniref:Mitochondrial import inner membrane translocase subunit Tim21 n=1 Tax=Saccharomyces arboricola (strain H-6 / AS 2.3317 / CBS 10644) TaxID=1160507 RepID=J8PNL4_SACAR|nr:tim21p [Saccharomyces arboricola H-6]
MNSNLSRSLLRLGYMKPFPPRSNTSIISSVIAHTSLIGAMPSNRTRLYSNGNSTASEKKDDKAGNKNRSLWPQVKSASTFTFSGILVIGAVGISTIVIYLILSELFSPSGDTQLFNRAVSMVEKSKDVRSLLQCKDNITGKERLKAYGELITSDKWTRNRPIVSTKKIDREGRTHHYMRFHIESKKKIALVHLEAKESKKNYQPDFINMYVDVPGEKRFYLVKPKLNPVSNSKGFLGIRWGPKKN